MPLLVLAMIALGVQINRTPLNFFKADVMLATSLRLIVSPLIAAIITILFIMFYGPMHPIAAQTIVITYSVPTAINMALIAIEMKNNPEYATQIVMGHHNSIGSNYAAIYYNRLLPFPIILILVYLYKKEPF